MYKIVVIWDKHTWDTRCQDSVQHKWSRSLWKKMWHCKSNRIVINKTRPSIVYNIASNTMSTTSKSSVVLQISFKKWICLNFITALISSTITGLLVGGRKEKFSRFATIPECLIWTDSGMDARTGLVYEYAYRALHNFACGCAMKK